jgi:1-acyl-sn-glycerol-3-phosphate acyltransferase
MASAFKIQYPRRQVSRAMLRFVAGRLIHLLSDLRIQGQEHVPDSGPIILAANHFDFIDPALLLYASPRLVEFVGGANRPNAPLWARMIPELWGFIAAYRGGYSRSTLELSQQVLAQDGVLGIFPEGGSWAALLRPARPGLAFVAEKSGASVVPVSISGADKVLGGPKQPLHIQFHPPVPPPRVVDRASRRQQLDAYGDKIMSVIAQGLPQAQRGRFSSDPEARAAAEAVSAFPFTDPELRGG